MLRIVIRLNRCKLVAFYLLRMLACVRAFSLALMYIAVYSTLSILLELSLAATLVSNAKALFRGAKMLTSSS